MDQENQGIGQRLRVLVPPFRFFVRPGKGEQMFSTCVVPTVKDGGGGVTFLGALMVTLLVLFALSWTIAYVSTDNEPPPTQLQAMEELFDQEGECWSSVSHDLTSTITLDHMVNSKQPTSAQQL